MTEKEEYIPLMVKCLCDEADPPEWQVLQSWLMADEANQQYFESIQVIWQSRRPLPSFDSQSAFLKLKAKINI
jgi:hypothetical protein